MLSSVTVDAAREPGALALRAAGGDGRLRASMNGRVIAGSAIIGERVAAGRPLVTFEAMKMEHVHAAPVGAVVTRVHVEPGDQVSARRGGVELQPETPVPG